MIYWRELAMKALEPYRSGKDEHGNPIYDNVPRELDRAIETLLEVAELEGKVRSNITVSSTVLWAGLGEWPLNAIFGSPGVLKPEAITDEGKIVCINLPISMGESATVALVLWKLAFQKHLLRRAYRNG